MEDEYLANTEEAKERGERPAFPTREVWDGDKADIGWIGGGLTKRELFAAMAMQGMLSHVETQRWIQKDPRCNGDNFAQAVSINAVEFSDALIAELEEGK